MLSVGMRHVLSQGALKDIWSDVSFVFLASVKELCIEIAKRDRATVTARRLPDFHYIIEEILATLVLIS